MTKEGFTQILNIITPWGMVFCAGRWGGGIQRGLMYVYDYV